MTHADIIRLLGGPTKLARALGVAHKAPLHWRLRGIPARFWHQIEQLPAAVDANITAKNVASAPVGERKRPKETKSVAGQQVAA